MQTRSPFFTAVLAASMLAASEAVASIEVNGGLSWNGWTSRGTSTTLGVYGKGSTANVYEIYTTYFNYGGETVTGSPAGSLSLAPGGTGAFAAGNRILGVGIRRISGAAISGSGGASIVRFTSPVPGTCRLVPGTSRHVLGTVSAFLRHRFRVPSAV
jgi:hypothetical protein